MERRRFIAGSAATAAAVSLAARADAQAAEASAPPRMYYELRRYSLVSGPQMLKLTDSYLGDALIPALGRAGIGPVGAFRLEYGPETPAIYVLMPSQSPGALAGIGRRLEQDEDFQRLAAPFNNVAATVPAFLRMDSTLLLAFEGFPGVRLPAAKRGTRIFQLRTYENPTPRAHSVKLEMFHHGEFEIFQRTGLEAVFFGETLIGSRMPSLTYMLTFKDLADLEAKWDVFRSDPAWKKLSSDPRYASEATVSNITNLVLSPTTYSQI